MCSVLSVQTLALIRIDKFCTLTKDGEDCMHVGDAAE